MLDLLNSTSHLKNAWYFLLKKSTLRPWYTIIIWIPIFNLTEITIGRYYTCHDSLEVDKVGAAVRISVQIFYSTFASNLKVVLRLGVQEPENLMNSLIWSLATSKTFTFNFSKYLKYKNQNTMVVHFNWSLLFEFVQILYCTSSVGYEPGAIFY